MAEQAAAPVSPPVSPPYAPAATYAPAVGAAPAQPMMAPARNNTLAIVLEIIPGLFGFFGIGWLASGYVTTGLILLIAGIMWTVIGSFFSVLTFGFGFACMAVINIVVVIVSALTLSSRLKRGR